MSDLKSVNAADQPWTTREIRPRYPRTDRGSRALLAGKPQTIFGRRRGRPDVAELRLSKLGARDQRLKASL